MRNIRYFIGNLTIAIGEYENVVRYLVVANSPAGADKVLEAVAATYYGDGSAPREDSGYYANGGEVHVSVSNSFEVGLAAFEELRRVLPTRYDDNCPTVPDIEVAVPEGFKALAKSLVNKLASRGTEVKHSVMLEVLAGAFGAKNWQVLNVKLQPQVMPEEAPEPMMTVYPEPVLFEVDVVRTGYGHRTISVLATSAAEAEELALDEAGNHEYNEHTADYRAESARVLTP